MGGKIVSIEGIQELQDYNIRAIEALKPSGRGGEAVKRAVTMAHRYAVAITHVITGSLRGSHTMQIERGGAEGRIFINPTTINPRTRQRPAEYGVYEHERGGSHAFYQRTVEEEGDRIVEEARNVVIRGLS